MKHRLLWLVAPLFISGCDPSPQGDVHNLSDAIDHCRDYSRAVLAPNVDISLDHLSTRENREFYDVFLNVGTRERRSYAHCRIDMKGLIVLHETPGFPKKGGAFGGF